MHLVRRFAAAFSLVFFLAVGGSAQTMRFDTNVGSFDVILNPDNDANLRPLVDNLVAYIGLGRYHHTVINRAVDGGPGTADDFVLQMGSFLAFPGSADLWAAARPSIQALTAVRTDINGDGQVDFTAKSNLRGTVSLALSNGPNTGTSSFFINLGNNTGLDSQGFVPFARIADMATIDKIMGLTQRDLSTLSGSTGSLTFSDVPIFDDRLVVIEGVHVVQASADFSFVGPISRALASGSATAPIVAPGGSSSSLIGTNSGIGIGAPEPSTGLLCLIAIAALKRRRQA